MGKILNVNDYSAGYSQGKSDGYVEGYDAGVAEYEHRIAVLIAEIRTLDARVAVALRRMDQEER